MICDGVGNFKETTTKLIDMERFAQFKQEQGHFESIQAVFVTYVPPAFEKSPLLQRIKTFLFRADSENEDSIVDKQLERFEEVIRGLKDSLSLIMKVQRMTFHPDNVPDPYAGTSELLEAVNACVNGGWHSVRLPAFPYYLDCLIAQDCFNGKNLEYNHEFVQCVSLVNYPAGTFPSILSDLQALPISFRWY